MSRQWSPLSNDERQIDIEEAIGTYLTASGKHLALVEVTSSPMAEMNRELDRELMEAERWSKGRLKLIPFDKIKPGTARRYLVKGLIPYPGLTVSWGPPKSGKSFWVLDVTLRVALGWDYRGRRVHQGPVVYCCFEGQSGIMARVEAFRQEFLSEQTEDVPFYLQPLTLDLVKDHDELIDLIEHCCIRPVVVVLDTLNRSLKGSESSDQDMTAYVRAADVIRDTFNCSVIVVHHCGLREDRPRGHTSLTGAADAQLEVKRDTLGNIFVTVEWMKDGVEGDTIASRLKAVEVGVDDDGEPITSCVVVDTEAQKAKVKKGKTLGTRDTICHAALQQAIIEGSEKPPASNQIPANIRVVTRSLWKKYAVAKGVSGSDNEDSQRRAFERGVESLIAKGVAGAWQDWCWLI
jgi:hypothetical protein